MMTEKEVKAFIIASHKQLTVSDIVEESGVPKVTVSRYFESLGLPPLKVKERNFNFVRDNHGQMSVEKMARALQIAPEYLIKLYGAQFSLTREQKSEEVPEVPKVKKKDTQRFPRASPRAILSAFRMDNAGHYHTGVEE